ncbi:MAG: replicative DNA helicase [Marivibrio sp.]|uniref:replicative DNA helicase n=1 Tax=Marivibrio sp. TaxID=2039719 RepID=UPI0032ED2D9D
MSNPPAPTASDEPRLDNVTPLRDGGEGEARAVSLRQPPHNIEVEQALLGAILRNNRAYEAAGDLLEARHFYAPEHQRLFQYIRTIVDRAQVANAASLGHIVDEDELLKGVGGREYLYQLDAGLVTIINARQYAETVRDLFIKRELIGLGEDVVNDAYDSSDLDFTAEKQIEKAEQRLYDLAVSGEADRTVVAIGRAAGEAVAAVEKAMQREGHVVGVTTGFRDVDNMLGGLHPSDLLILAGRPAMGKTALATNIAFNAAHAYKKIETDDGQEIEEGGHVLFFSLEMSSEQLAARIMAERARVSSDKMRRGEIGNEEFDRVAAAAEELSRLPLYIDDTPALSITGLRQRARRVKRQHGLHLIVVDYLQLLQPPADKRVEGRVNEVSEITRGLKTLAKELDVPVLALSQLSRQVENREDKRPQLADLRESGSIEQDADVVTFIYRPEYYLEKEHPEQRGNETPEKYQERVERHNQRLAEARNIAEVIIAKQRHGPVGTVELQFTGEFTVFSDLDRHHDGDMY